eukprot:TRINITY_DN30417_c0_g1_i2.p2 TRINITY_DN30417_c0_g1~~TRINITY_DN30417_c0_g1_i2.p2  ORF type:complete len:106 (-),score=8.77 TRINITY_DN30417_c0_g1_i2:691-1008(-)
MTSAIALTAAAYQAVMPTATLPGTRTKGQVQFRMLMFFAVAGAAFARTKHRKKTRPWGSRKAAFEEEGRPKSFATTPLLPTSGRQTRRRWVRSRTTHGLVGALSL